MIKYVYWMDGIKSHPCECLEFTYKKKLNHNLHTLKRRIAALVIIWQSYNSIRCKLWHDTKCSNVWSVINGQLSNSKTDKLSAAQLPAANCRIPSSVINSQCDKV